jgi:transcription antitermination protein NusB
VPYPKRKSLLAAKANVAPPSTWLPKTSAFVLNANKPSCPTSPAATVVTIIMKQKTDPRHQRRVVLMRQLFGFAFHQSEDTSLSQDIIKSLGEIDELIATAAPEWPIGQVNKIDLAILRLAVYELKQNDTPYKVVIDEAVELAKEYGSEKSQKFVNGVLGSVVEKIRL